MSYQTHSFLVGPLSEQRSIDEMLYRKSLKFVYSVMNSNNSIIIVAHIGQLIRQSAKSPIGGNVACFRYKFGIDVDDNVLKNLRLISRYFELNGERNITASIAIDLQSMIEDNYVRFTRDELSYMLNNVYIMYEMTVNTQLAVVFYHSPCCIIFRTKFFFILSCIECIHVSWCTTVRNKSIIYYYYMLTKFHQNKGAIINKIQKFQKSLNTIDPTHHTSIPKKSVNLESNKPRIHVLIQQSDYQS